ncbi:MAG: Smr/MutS family protein [Bacteroidales bacterium]|jgi:DNA mismatch repair protein MutS2|nr:Smr/MutS family protein [Bacteroidales bacterium]
MEDYGKLEQKIGFDIVRHSIEERCSTEYARYRASSEKISFSGDEIELRLSLTDEMRVVCMFENSFPGDSFIDGSVFLKALETPSSVISLENLRRLDVLMGNIRGISSFFEKCGEDRYPCLKKLASGLLYFPEVGRRIAIILDKNGDIKDRASQELFDIRQKIRTKTASISARTQSILKSAIDENVADEGASVSVRDGIPLIPVSASNKRKLQGLVYGESSSGKTVFIEPLEIVELNNQVRELHFAEEREILKILADFSDFLRPYVPDLISGAKIVGELDFIRAKALAGLSMEAGKPLLSDNGELVLSRARHPLLEKALKKERKKIVPLSLSLNRVKHILVISGPNAGGKSVCLKTVGLLQYMFQWGALVPASESSEFPVFNKIFIDIGDEQSLENDLSTYSSHLLNMKRLLAEADDRTLVLIDEFGSGTEPAAGGAIAETILSEVESRGTFGIVTTHYTNLKLYASNGKGAVNGAMTFDVAHISPLYQLEIGLPGNSFAFELARKIGLPENIVKRAEECAGENFVNMEKQLRKISRNKRKLDEKLAKIKHTDKNLENIADTYQKELSEISSTKKEIISKAKEEAAEIIAEANRKIEATIKEIRESQAEKERTKTARQKLKVFDDKLKKEEEESEKDKLIEKKIQQISERKRRREERRHREEERQRKGMDAGQAASPSTVSSGRKEKHIDETPVRKGDKVRIKGKGLMGEIIETDGKWASLSVGNIISRAKLSDIEKISNHTFDDFVKERPHSSVPSDSAGIDERKINFKPYIDVRGQRLDEALNSVSMFIDDAIMVGADEVKILHGKGTGILKTEIRKYLKANPAIGSAEDEDIRYGGSGITVVKMN